MEKNYLILSENQEIYLIMGNILMRWEINSDTAHNN